MLRLVDAHIDFHILIEALGSLVDSDLRIVEDTTFEVSLAACFTLQKTCIVVLSVKSVLVVACIDLGITEGAACKLCTSNICLLVAQVISPLSWFLRDQLVRVGHSRGHELLPQ